MNKAPHFKFQFLGQTAKECEINITQKSVSFQHLDTDSRECTW